MNTPIRDFVEKYCESDAVRLHMPGHKGKDFLGFERYDITEIDGADILYNAEGIIKKSEENASSLFGSYRTFYSCEGSSLCIKAMLAVIASQRKNKSRKTRIVASRNVHKAFIYGCALCDIDVEWIYPSVTSHLCTCVISPSALENKLSRLDGEVDAVYITSPDYLGQLSDIRGLSYVCDQYSVPLLVDNAHGAYLAFLEESLHPINNGAYMCCDSAHKTLPVLTGGAYLHLSEKACENAEFIENMMSLMGSTSPSYLILQSLDMCNMYLSDGYKDRLASTVKRYNSLKEELRSIGACIESSEPLKLVVNTKQSEVSTESVLTVLNKAGIVPEFYDDRYIVFMFTPENTDSDFSRLRNALLSVNYGEKISDDCLSIYFNKPEKSMSIREAMFSYKKTVEVGSAEGRICASPAVTCPPAVSPVVCGEIISSSAIRALLYYGIEKIEVVK